MSVIEIYGLKKVFPSANSELVIIDSLDLTIEEGKLISITGDSGSGKSTLLNLIAGLDEVSGGKILSCGLEISNLQEKDLTNYRKNSLGLVFQFHFLLKEFTVLENVFLPGWMATGSRNLAEKKAKELLDAVGLSSRLLHYPGQLSGGERQRVALARSLINNPSLILADEPTGNLDEENAKNVEDLLFNLVRDFGKTLILVTHDKRIASRADIHYHLSHKKLEIHP